jgi:hypothetical protein
MESLDSFNFVFSLYSLLLGLSIAVILSGFAHALKARPPVPIGWLTSLLGIFMMLDVTSFWTGAWRARYWFAPQYGHLFIGLVVTALYYFAASLVFPKEAKTAAEFDDHYYHYHRPILLAVAFCNLVTFGWQDALEFRELPPAWWFGVPAYYVLLVTAVIIRRKTLSIACLAGLIAVYLFSAMMSTVWPWR